MKNIKKSPSEIRITIKFVGTLRNILNMKEVTAFCEEDITIKEVLKKLVIKYGKKFEEEIMDLGTERIEPFLIIMVNGQNAIRLDGLSTKLKDGDILVIMPPITGGAPE